MSDLFYLYANNIGLHFYIALLQVGIRFVSKRIELVIFFLIFLSMHICVDSENLQQVISDSYSCKNKILIKCT